MSYTKDYYQILGVMPTAEDIVIRAAYKALAQRYHPDKYKGDPAEAKRIMQEIIEAYAILSDVDKRKHYDVWLSQQSNGSEYQPDDQDDELNAAMAAYDRDWNTACTIYPDLQEHYLWLNKVAHRLGATYKILLLETKNFQDRTKIAGFMEDEFFKSYFGSNVDIVTFAKSLVRDGKKAAARSLNNYIRVVGESNRVIDAVCAEHGLAEYGMSSIKDKINFLGQKPQKLSELRIDVRRSGIETQFWNALEQGKPEEVKYLVSENPVLMFCHYPNDSNENTPLHVAVRLRYVELAKFFLESGADADVRNGWGSTPRSMVEIYGNANMQELFEGIKNNTRLINSS